jgi:polysaccharide biosynthesis protein PslE
LDLQLKEQELLIKYKENSPPVRDVRKEIHMASDFLNAQERDVASKVRSGNLVYQEAEKERIKTEADLRAQEAKLASLTLQVSLVDKDLKGLDTQERDFRNLNRDMASNERNYQNYLEKYEEARISDDMDRKKMANISVIQAAAVPAEPIRPKKALNIGLAILLGAASALGSAFLSEYLGRTFETAEDVERRLGLPVLASVTGSRK